LSGDDDPVAARLLRGKERFVGDGDDLVECVTDVGE
jgi:hypothetical protein